MQGSGQRPADRMVSHDAQSVCIYCGKHYHTVLRHSSLLEYRGIQLVSCSKYPLIETMTELQEQDDENPLNTTQTAGYHNGFAVNVYNRRRYSSLQNIRQR